MNDLTNSFYIATIHEIIVGTDIREIEGVLKDFEDEEMYYECAGIFKALELAKKVTIGELRDEYKKLIKKHNDKQKHSKDSVELL